ncbi:MAG TPA: N,N-dimethylformamidase beta subunit family domain-containing protein [Stellaceae bacterium]|nr:N,N-dimethylformamidase beta subunit family domain-containing protein [Stellaceae bacterium]
MKGPGVVGYVDALYAHPGDEVTVRVSVLDPGRRYRAELVRLICGEALGLKEEIVASGVSGEHLGELQPVPIGSYAIVESLPPLGAVELSLLVWPTLPGRGVQSLVSLGGIHLFLDAAGAVTLASGGETVSTARPLRSRAWYGIEARYDPATGAASVKSTPIPGVHDDIAAEASGRFATPAKPEAPLLFAARRNENGTTVEHFNGKIEAPALRSGTVAAEWDFARGIGTTAIEDRSPLKLQGRTVNAPKRAVTGSRWDGSVHDWRRDPSHYAAIHFHSDDLYDCCWKPSLRFRLPADLRSGFYAVRLQAAGPPFHVGLIVSPKPGAARAKLAVLASTATYLAYANYRRRMLPGPFELSMGHLPTVDMTDVLLAEHSEYGSSTYDTHRDGFGVAHASTRRPLFNMRPTGRYWNFAMDLCLVDWLEAQGIAYDVISDHELQARGLELLAPYGAVMSVSHPEYYSLEMLQALEAYLGRGGRFMYMGGNGFYWRVSFDPAHPDMIKLRRAEDGTRAWAEQPGQYYHSTGEYGGLWRRIGRPPNTLVGIGFIAQGFDAGSYYRRTAASRDPRAAFIFKGIEDEIIGDFGSSGGGAAGLEIDCYDAALGSPPHALTVASSEKHSQAFLLVNEEMLSNTRGVDGTLNARVKADMVFFETRAGGAVFSTGSIAYVASLAHNGYRNNVSRLTRNVVERFLDPAPFTLPKPQGR